MKLDMSLGLCLRLSGLCRWELHGEWYGRCSDRSPIMTYALSQRQRCGDQTGTPKWRSAAIRMFSAFKEVLVLSEAKACSQWLDSHMDAAELVHCIVRGAPRRLEICTVYGGAVSDLDIQSVFALYYLSYSRLAPLNFGVGWRILKSGHLRGHPAF